MGNGVKTDAGITLIEVLCVLIIVITILVICYPLIGAVKERARLTRSMSNMHQIHTAIILYCDQEGGGITNLPRARRPLVDILSLPSELFFTGGTPVYPGDPAVYRMVWPRDGNPEYDVFWNRYVATTEGNPVLIIDETFPNAIERGPFVKKSRYGIFWQGDIKHRRYAGVGENLMQNWR